MNAMEQAGALTGPHVIEAALRMAMTNQKLRQQVLDATDWDSSMPSKVVSGTAGITLDKLGGLCAALGLTIVEVRYMDYLSLGNEIGSKCCRARQSMGSCGARQ